MEPEPTTGVSSQAASALVAHLRQHPEDLSRPAKELAGRFGLSQEFVENVVSGISSHDMHAPGHQDFDFKESFAFVGKFFRAIGHAFDRVTRKPEWFVAVTMAIGLILLAIVGRTIPSVTVVENTEINLDDAVGAVAVVVVFLLHMACYFYRRMARHAVVGGLIVWVGSGTGLMTLVWAQTKATGGEAERFTSVFIAGLVAFVLAMFYSGIGAIMSVLGAWVHMRLVEQQQEHMSRQDLLERYFELQSRLQDCSQHAAQKPVWERMRFVTWLRANPYVGSFFIGLVTSLCSVLLLGNLGLDPEARNATNLSAPIVFVAIVTGTAVFFLYIAVGFVLARVRKAALSGIVLYLGTIPPTMLPIGHYGFGPFEKSSHWLNALINMAFMAGVSAIAALGGIVQQKAYRETNLQENDQAALVAEMLRIQLRLSDRMKQVCVMVVDAAKSSVMKAEADPLAVEYSFREYQEWLEAIGSLTDGRVHSTAGDGAVISFPTADGALAAAKRIQTDLMRFNREVNRLKSPFRLRIGLHAGEVAGDIGEVQFTEVIDIAAHVQEVAPISGIAVTDSVANALPEEQFLQLSVDVDGHKVFLVMNPIEI